MRNRGYRGSGNGSIKGMIKVSFYVVHSYLLDIAIQLIQIINSITSSLICSAVHHFITLVNKTLA